jgi:FtsH-binding integral membrane protein
MADVEYGSMPGVDAPKRNSSHWDVKDEDSYEMLKGIAPVNVHNNFIRKVYGLLAVELLYTSAISALIMFVSPIRTAVVNFATNNPLVFEILLIVCLVASLCWLMCVQKQYPLNMCALAVFITFMSIDVGFICAVYYEAGYGNLILISVLITAVIFIGLSAYAWLSESDFSYMGGFLFAALIGLIFLGIVQLFVHVKWLYIAYCALGVLVFSGYIIFDTWKIKTKLGPDDSVHASIMLYLDLVNLFLMILQLLAAAKRR